MAKVTDKEVLMAIYKYRKLNGFAPSYRDIKDSLGLSSTSSVHHRLQKLIDARLLKSDTQGKARTVRLTQKGLDMIGVTVHKVTQP